MWFYFKCFLIVQHYLTAYPAVYGQFPQAIPQQMAAVPAQREGKQTRQFFKFITKEMLHFLVLYIWSIDWCLKWIEKAIGVAINHRSIF